MKGIELRHLRVRKAMTANELAEKAGNPITMNVVMMGALCALESMPLPAEVVRVVIERRTPSRLTDINLRAFSMGLNAFASPD